MFNNFEILVSEEDDRYKAVSPAFPECEGVGSTKEEAVEDLGDDIAFHLEEKVYNVVDHTIATDGAKFVSKEDLRARRSQQSFAFSPDMFLTQSDPDILRRLRKYSSLDAGSDVTESLLRSLSGSHLDDDSSSPVVGFNIPLSLN